MGVVLAGNLVAQICPESDSDADGRTVRTLCTYGDIFVIARLLETLPQQGVKN